MKRIPLQCSRMAAAAAEYCHLIDTFDGMDDDSAWVTRLGKMLPRLHIAVTALSPSTDSCPYHFPDDDDRIELYMRLHHLLQDDRVLNLAYGKSYLRLQSCDGLADDLTDMYFDLKHGLDLLVIDPEKAADMWHCSFYLHWGQHLLDAECWLHAAEAGEEPLSLSSSGWRWPRFTFATS